jgi:hypothetical protein
LNLTKSHGSYDPLPSSKQERWGNKEKMKIRDIFNVEWVGIIIYIIHIRIEFCFVCNKHALTLPNHEALISLFVLLKSSQPRWCACYNFGTNGTKVIGFRVKFVIED